MEVKCATSPWLLNRETTSVRNEEEKSQQVEIKQEMDVCAFGEVMGGVDVSQNRAGLLIKRKACELGDFDEDAKGEESVIGSSGMTDNNSPSGLVEMLWPGNQYGERGRKRSQSAQDRP